MLVGGPHAKTITRPAAIDIPGPAVASDHPPPHPDRAVTEAAVADDDRGGISDVDNFFILRQVAFNDGSSLDAGGLPRGCARSAAQEHAGPVLPPGSPRPHVVILGCAARPSGHAGRRGDGAVAADRVARFQGPCLPELSD